MPRFAQAKTASHAVDTADLSANPPQKLGFPLLLAIGLIDSATRMAFLTYLPFLLTHKGASVATVGIALTLVFAGGAAGKLACALHWRPHRRRRDGVSHRGTHDRADPGSAAVAA